MELIPSCFHVKFRYLCCLSDMWYNAAAGYIILSLCTWDCPLDGADIQGLPFESTIILKPDEIFKESRKLGIEFG